MRVYFYYVLLNKKIILINRDNECNWVNESYYKIEYLNLHPSFDFSVTYLVIVNNFFYLLMVLSLFN
jgi:hypothetical protein